MLVLSVITFLFALKVSALPTSRPEIDERDNYSVVRNDLGGPCKPITIIFARGTTELGNVGTFAGPPFFNAVGDILGDSNVAVQGVDYPASIAGYLAGGSPAGASKLASLTNEAASKCPSTQIILSGYRYELPQPTLTYDSY
jgi:Cutinase